jgi:sugar/nucleoside kinase (ribokinase family)
MRLLGVVGLVSLDRVDGGLPRLGGAPYHAARALRLLGYPAALATKLAPADRPRLAALGLPASWRPASRTISFRIENRGDGRLLTLEELGEAWAPEEARGWLVAALTGADWLHAGALTRSDFSAETLALLRRGRRVLLDAQALVRPARLGPVVPDAEFDREILRHVDALKLSDEDAAALGLGPDTGSLGSLGVPEVVLTRGRRGAVVYAQGVAEHVPTRPLEGVDPTGAGDAFAAAYLSFRLRRHGPRSAARLANDTVYALLARWNGR